MFRAYLSSGHVPNIINDIIFNSVVLSAIRQYLFMNNGCVYELLIFGYWNLENDLSHDIMTLILSYFFCFSICKYLVRKCWIVVFIQLLPNFKIKLMKTLRNFVCTRKLGIPINYFLSLPLGKYSTESDRIYQNYEKVNILHFLADYRIL